MLHLPGLEHISVLWIAGSIVQIYLVSALIDSFICAAIDTTIDTTIDTFIKHYLANSTCQADWLCPNILEISSNSAATPVAIVQLRLVFFGISLHLHDHRQAMVDYQRLNPNGNSEEDIDLGDGRPIIVYRLSPKSATRPYLLVLTGFVVGILTAALSMYIRHTVPPHEHPAYTHEYPFLSKSACCFIIRHKADQVAPSKLHQDTFRKTSLPTTHSGCGHHRAIKLGGASSPVGSASLAMVMKNLLTSPRWPRFCAASRHWSRDRQLGFCPPAALRRELSKTIDFECYRALTAMIGHAPPRLPESSKRPGHQRDKSAYNALPRIPPPIGHLQRRPKSRIQAGNQPRSFSNAWRRYASMPRL